MYRLLERIPASPMNSRIRQEPPPKQRPLKRGNRPEKACRRRDGYSHRLTYLGGQ